MLVFAAIAIVVLAAVAATFAQAGRYYLSDFARATRLDWSTMMRDAHMREVFRMSKSLQRSGRRLAHEAGADRRKGGVRQLFDLAVPSPSGEPVALDAVAVAPSGVIGIIVLEGAGALHGDVDADQWLAVTGRGDELSERVFPNVATRVQKAGDALKSLLLADDESCAALPVEVAVVHAKGLDLSDAQFSDGISVEASDSAGRLIDAAKPSGTDGDSLTRAYRILKACANSHAGFPGEASEESGRLSVVDAFRDSHAADWARRAFREARPDTVGGELVRRADRLAVDKENFDALTWDRITEIGEDLATERNPDRIAELSAELRLIARTNVALNYRFGIAQAPENAPLSGAGLVMETDTSGLRFSKPDAELSEALSCADANGFFEGGLADDGDEVSRVDDRRRQAAPSVVRQSWALQGV